MNAEEIIRGIMTLCMAVFPVWAGVLLYRRIPKVRNTPFSESGDLESYGGYARIIIDDMPYSSFERFVIWIGSFSIIALIGGGFSSMANIPTDSKESLLLIICSTVFGFGALYVASTLPNFFTLLVENNRKGDIEFRSVINEMLESVSRLEQANRSLLDEKRELENFLDESFKDYRDLNGEYSELREKFMMLRDECVLDPDADEVFKLEDEG